MTLKILSVIGTRPEAVKMAPVVRLLKDTPGIESRICVTAQHRQMLDQVLELFQIEPHYDLDLMRENQSMAQISAGIFTHLDPVLEEFQPDWVLAEGDTTTVVTTSLLAFYRRIKFGHVEAGLRTHNKWHPFPEEINRRLATVIADLHFAPTQLSRQNLLNESIPNETIIVTGNPVIDALTYVAQQEEPEEIKELLGRLEIHRTESSVPETRRLIAAKTLVSRWKIFAMRSSNLLPEKMRNLCILFILTQTCRNRSIEF
jgi:UDP-N-acetylglucosamine 2-epimerase (non-hydrolysing)